MFSSVCGSSSYAVYNSQLIVGLDYQKLALNDIFDIFLSTLLFI